MIKGLPEHLPEKPPPGSPSMAMVRWVRDVLESQGLEVTVDESVKRDDNPNSPFVTKTVLEPGTRRFKLTKDGFVSVGTIFVRDGKVAQYERDAAWAMGLTGAEFAREAKRRGLTFREE